MDKHEFNSEMIELSLPANAAYVSAARLTASSIANRMSFDIDEIEDIKAAVSEACTYLIKKSPHDGHGAFKIMFMLCENMIKISFSLFVDSDFSYPEDEMSILMINALMDTFKTELAHDGSFNMSMSKIHKEITFD